MQPGVIPEKSDVYIVDEETLLRRLEQFGGTEGERRAVARAARDLHDYGRFAEDEGYPLSTDVVMENLSDRRDGGPADRWNWWIGALEISHETANHAEERQGTDCGTSSTDNEIPIADTDSPQGDRYLAFQVRRWEE